MVSFRSEGCCVLPDPAYQAPSLCTAGRFLIGAAKCGAKGISIKLGVAAAAKAKHLVKSGKHR